MKKTSKIAALAVALAIVMAAFVVALDQGPLSTGSADTGDNNDLPGGDDPQNGDKEPTDELPGDPEPSVTTITATKTATGFWEKRTTYSWELEKHLKDDICEMQIEPGECVEMSYVIDVNRSVCIEEVFGVRGLITVTNTGDCPTEGLAITDIVQVWDGCEFVDAVTVCVDVSAKPVLQAGECYSYAYEVLFDAELIECDLRNVADVTICNFDGNDGSAFGVQACADFELPCEMECIVIDEAATLTDYFSIPAGFAAIPLTDVGPWVLGGDDCNEWDICVEFILENREAPRYNTYCIANHATLVTCDTETCLTSEARLTVTTGEDETTLCVEKTAAVTGWTEYIRYELDPETFIYIGSDMPVDEDLTEPKVIEMNCTSDVTTLTVAGAIKVINTGCYPTEGLKIVDTIQMLQIDPEAPALSNYDGDCWVNIACIEVDTSCMPMLLPGEWYYYPYEVTFTIDDLELAGLANCLFRNQAYVEICNYDDDAEYNGVYDYAPLFMPLYPDMITVETVAEMECCDVIPFGECASLNVKAAFSYRQLVVVTNTDEKSTIDVCTDLTLNGKVWADDCICEAECFDLAIHVDSSKCAAGEVRDITLETEDYVDDCDTLFFCLGGQEVEVSIYSFLSYLEGQELYLDASSFSFGEGKMAVGAVLINFEVDAAD